jgi:hypothetical protein
MTILTNDDTSNESPIRPSDPETHYTYDFFIRVTSKGGFSKIKGPYILEVGCTATSVGIEDNDLLSII